MQPLSNALSCKMERRVSHSEALSKEHFLLPEPPVPSCGGDGDKGSVPGPGTRLAAAAELRALCLARPALPGCSSSSSSLAREPSASPGLGAASPALQVLSPSHRARGATRAFLRAPPTPAVIKLSRKVKE
ncbi:hypothetical protein EK904_012786 [Melospiza melodia maxima]|nr:hypothetical protein EK904_012786 [Melospiza melodia maxima]